MGRILQLRLEQWELVRDRSDDDRGDAEQVEDAQWADDEERELVKDRAQDQNQVPDGWWSQEQYQEPSEARSRTDKDRPTFRQAGGLCTGLG